MSRYFSHNCRLWVPIFSQRGNCGRCDWYQATFLGLARNMAISTQTNVEVVQFLWCLVPVVCLFPALRFLQCSWFRSSYLPGENEKKRGHSKRRLQDLHRRRYKRGARRRRPARPTSGGCGALPPPPCHQRLCQRTDAKCALFYDQIQRDIFLHLFWTNLNEFGIALGALLVSTYLPSLYDEFTRDLNESYLIQLDFK